MENTASKKKNNKKEVKPAKAPAKIQEPKTYLEKQEEAKNEHELDHQEPEEPPHVAERKNLLYLMQLCTKEQIGVIFMLLKNNCAECLSFDTTGAVSVHGEKVSDAMLKRLTSLMEMWGISFKNVTLTNNNKRK
jgi:hypothetical protein